MVDKQRNEEIKQEEKKMREDKLFKTTRKK
jgi:hypothetical protein